MEVLAILALLAALVASVLAILSLQRLAELNGLPREVERLAREGRFLRQRLRELEAEAGGGAEDVSLEEAAAPSRTEEFEVPSAGESGSTPVAAETPGAREPIASADELPDPDGIADDERPSAAVRARDLATVLAGAEDAEVVHEVVQEAPASPAPRRAAAKRSSVDLERWLGVRGAALAGGLVMALAAILLFQHAYERNWVTPESRVAGGLVWGFVLLFAGQWARKRTLAWVPGALEGAGLVAFYASTWGASPEVYGFIPTWLAFALMGLVTALGCYLALRKGSLLTAQVGLIGGFATPLLLNTGQPQPFGLFGYLLLLDLGLLFLGRRRSWPSVGILAVLGTALFEVLWVVAPDTVGRDLLPWAGGTQELFGAAMLLTFGLVFLATGLGRPASGKGHEGATWALVELGGLAASAALAIFLAVESDLSSDLWPTAITVTILTAGALYLGVGRGDAVVATAAALLGLAMVGAWGIERELATAAEAWQLAGAALVLGVLVGLPRLVQSLAAPLATTARTTSLGVAFVVLVLALGGSSPDAGWATMAPLVVGLVAAAALVAGSTLGAQGGPEQAKDSARLSGPEGRAFLAVLAGALTGAGLFLRSLAADAAGDPFGLGPWSVVLVLALTLGLAAAAARRFPTRRMAVYPVLGAGVGALAMLLDHQLLEPLEQVVDQAHFRALVSHGLLAPFLVAAVVLGAAATAAWLVRDERATWKRATAGDRGLAAWLEGRLLTVLAAAFFVVQLGAWVDAVKDMGRDLPLGQASYVWGLAAGDGAQALGFAGAVLCCWLLLLWPAVHARFVVGDLAGLGTWPWRTLAVVALVMSVMLEQPFQGTTDLGWEREGGLLAAAALGLLVVVAWRLVSRADEPAPEGQRTAVTWVGFVAVLFLAFVAGDSVSDQEVLTFFGALALLHGILALAARRSAAAWTATAVLLLGVLVLNVNLLEDRGPEFGTPLLGWHTYVSLGLAAVAGALAWLSERTEEGARVVGSGGPDGNPDGSAAARGAALLNHPQGGREAPHKRTRGIRIGDVVSARSPHARRMVLGATTLVLVFLWLNLEISNHFDGARFAAGDRTVDGPNLVIGGLPPRDLAMSLAWGVFALALLILGSRRASGAIRWTSLGLMLAAITKVFLSDLSHLEGLYRVASLAGLALSLLLVSVLYQRFVFGRGDEPEKEPGEEPDDGAGPGAQGQHLEPPPGAPPEPSA